VSPLLEVTDLRVRFDDEVDALRGVSFSLDRGQSLAIVGETGSGKSTLALCLAGLIQPPAARGSVSVDGEQLLGASDDVLRELRWKKVALALQGTPFNPVVTIGAQVAEPLTQRLGMGRGDAARRAQELAAEVGLNPALLERYPHQVSGGERRLATLAMVLTLDPDLIVLDEPTAGLDPSTRQNLVNRVKELSAQRGFALIVISHDLSDAARLGERTIVLYAGEPMEDGPTPKVILEPAHPYSWALFNAYPVVTTTKELRPIRGLPPDPRRVPSGCPFHPRCTQAEDICVEQHPDLVEAAGRKLACHFGGLKTLLAATAVTKTFKGQGHQVQALKGVSISVKEGESVGLIGPSGSGKSTLGRILTGHFTPDSGQVTLEGQDLAPSWRKADRLMRRRVQLVMQDPWDALSPRMTVEELVREPLDISREDEIQVRREKVVTMLSSVGLPASGSFLEARTHQLSGGQLQRIALARALVAGPKLLVADEPTAMLDASEQARVLLVLKELQVQMGLGLILISHDMAVIRKFVDKIVVLEGGLVVEEGPSNVVSVNPQSEVTRRLISAAPAFAPD